MARRFNKLRRGRQTSGQADTCGTLAFQCQAVGLEQPEREYRFHPERKWRADLAFPVARVIVEVEGGLFAGTKGAAIGRHNSSVGFLKDMEKYNAAAILGWRVIRVTPRQVTRGEAVTIVEDAVKRI